MLLGYKHDYYHKYCDGVINLHSWINHYSSNQNNIERYV